MNLKLPKELDSWLLVTVRAATDESIEAHLRSRALRERYPDDARPAQTDLLLHSIRKNAAVEAAVTQAFWK